MSTRSAPAAAQAASTAASGDVIAPVWDRAARWLAALAPTVISSTGLPASVSTRMAARRPWPSANDSTYTATTAVSGWSARSASTSGAVTSTWLPIDTNREIPTPARAARPAISVPS